MEMFGQGVFYEHKPKIMIRNIIIGMLLALFATPAIAQDAYTLSIARIKYGGGGDWYSDEQSLTELIKFATDMTLLDIAPREDVVELSSDKVFTYPYLYLTGHGNVRFTAAEIERLRRYLEGGGFLHIDDNYGLDSHIRREMKKVFPDRDFVELPFEHPIFHTHFDFPNGLPKVHEHDGKAPQGFGLFIENRLAVFLLIRERPRRWLGAQSRSQRPGQQTPRGPSNGG